MDMDLKLKDLILESEKKWKIPSFNDEYNNLEFIAEQLDLSMDTIKTEFNQGELRILPNSIWDKLKNTDSTKTENFHDLVQVIQKYQKKDPEYSKDWKSIKNGMKDSMAKMTAPVVMKHGKDYYLISGNCRLMVAKALSVQPFVYLFTC